MTRAASRLPKDVSTELLASGGAIAEAWGTSATVVHQAGLAEWVPAARELLRTPLLRPPYVTVFADQAPVSTDRYCRPTRIVNSMEPEPHLDVELAEAELAAGSGVKFNRMELWCPPIAAMAEGFGAACGKRVKVWGFLSPMGQKMLPWHRDSAHVLALQVEGRKRWQLGGPIPADLSTAYNRIAAKAAQTVLLEPGDVLYLPHAFAHCAAADTERSFHLSFALEGTTAGDVRSRVLELVSEQLDRTDPREVGPEDLPRVLDHVCGVLASMRERLTELAAADAAATRSDRLSRLRDYLCDPTPRLEG